MRCPACHNESPDQARFCMHCGGPLADVLAEPARAPGAYTPPHLAERILTLRSALEGERKHVTVLFADVKGSLALSGQIDPERWHAILDRFFQILADGVHRFEGTVNQFTGDGVMALFGAPLAHEDHAQRACYAALHLQGALREYADELRRQASLSFSVRMGLNSGEVVVGKIGDDLRMDYTAQGHMVGLAARVQEVAAPDRIYLADATADQVRGWFVLESLGDFDLKGAPGPVQLHELVGPGEFRSRLDLSRARGFSRFLGRETEMRRLGDALAGALDGELQLVALVADAGVGKSRLAHEFMQRCRARGIPCTESHGVAHGRNIPLLPILELYREALGVSERDSPREARERIAGRVVLLDSSLAEALPLVFDFLGVPDPERPAPTLGPEARQRKLVDFDVHYSIARSRREPMVTLYEDVHWFDDASLSWLSTLIERAARSRTLLIVSFRPEFLSRWDAESHGEPLRLEPFGPDVARELLDTLMGDDRALVPLKEKIHARTLGNPFFIEEVVHALAETGQLTGEPGRYVLFDGLPDVQIPSSLQSLLSARIDQLPEPEKRLLQTASVIGRRIPRRVLEVVSGASGDGLDALLTRLLGREFLIEASLYPEAVYEFRHPLTREVANRSQLVARRQKIHEATARAIEEIDADHLEERAALLAHHWSEAGQRVESAHWHHRAARWVSSQNLSQSVEHWRTARELLLAPEAQSDVDSETLALGFAVRLGLLEVGGRYGLERGEASTLMNEGRVLAERIGDRQRLCLILVGYGNCCVFAARFDEGLAALREAEEVAEATRSRQLLVSVRVIGAWRLMLRGRLREALVLNGRAIDALEGGDSPLTSSTPGTSARLALLSMRSSIQMVLGDANAAEALIREVWKLDEDREHSEWIAMAHGSEARRALDIGESALAMRHSMRAVAIAEASQNTNALIQALQTLSRSHGARGEWKPALDVAERALGELRGAGILQAETRSLCTLALACLGAGDPARAIGLAREVIALSPGRDLVDGIEANLLLARSLRPSIGAEVEIDQIEGALARASELIEETGARYFIADLHREAAELASALGDREVAEREFTRARDAFRARGAYAHAAEVQRRLDSMPDG